MIKFLKIIFGVVATIAVILIIYSLLFGSNNPLKDDNKSNVQESSLDSTTELLLSNTENNLNNEIKDNNETDATGTISDSSTKISIQNTKKTLKNELLIKEDAANFINYDRLTIIIYINLLISVLLISLIFYILWKRNVILSKTAALVPEKWASYLHENSKSITSLENQTSSGLQKYYSTLKEYEKKLNHSQENITVLTREIKKLSDIIIQFQKTFDEKDKEIDRLKKGYDEKIYISFVRRFLNLYLLTKDEFNKEYSSNNKFINNLIQLFEAFLNDFNVESFEPELNSEFSKAGPLVKESPNFIETEDPANDLKISSIIRKGFRFKNNEENAIILPSEVTVFKFNKE